MKALKLEENEMFFRKKKFRIPNLFHMCPDIKLRMHTSLLLQWSLESKWLLLDISIKLVFENSELKYFLTFF